jgi:hypothetical protein
VALVLANGLLAFDTGIVVSCPTVGIRDLLRRPSGSNPLGISLAGLSSIETSQVIAIEAEHLELIGVHPDIHVEAVSGPGVIPMHTTTALDVVKNKHPEVGDVPRAP